MWAGFHFGNVPLHETDKGDVSRFHLFCIMFIVSIWAKQDGFNTLGLKRRAKHQSQTPRTVFRWFSEVFRTVMVVPPSHPFFWGYVSFQNSPAMLPPWVSRSMPGPLVGESSREALDAVVRYRSRSVNIISQLSQFYHNTMWQWCIIRDPGRICLIGLWYYLMVYYWRQYLDNVS